MTFKPRTEQFNEAPPAFIERDHTETIEIENSVVVYDLNNVPASGLDQVLADQWLDSEAQPANLTSGNTWVLISPLAVGDQLYLFGGLTDYEDVAFSQSEPVVGDQGVEVTVTVTYNPEELVTPSIPADGQQVFFEYRAIADLAGAKLTEDKLALDLGDCDLSNSESGDSVTVYYRSATKPTLNR